jgi:hypothetical protein
MSLRNDELTVKIPRRDAYNTYNRHFNFLWSYRTRSFR